MLTLTRGSNVYYSFLDLTERQNETQTKDFFKALLPITADRGLLNIIQDISSPAILKSEYGSYKTKYVDYSLQSAEDITSVGSNVLISRMSSGKEGYKTIDIYIDETNTDLMSTLPTFKNATATSQFQKGEDVFSEGIEDYKTYQYDKSDKPDIYTINGITVDPLTENAIRFKYLMTLQTFKPVNFDEFIIKIKRLNNSDKLTISENSYVDQLILNNKFIKIEIYNNTYSLIETFIGSIEEGYTDINNNEYYIENVINKKSNYLYIQGLTSETFDISTLNINTSNDIYFTNNTIINYDLLVTDTDTNKAFNTLYNNKIIIPTYGLTNKCLIDNAVVYDNDNKIDNAGGDTPIDADTFVVKEKANDVIIQRQNTYTLKDTNAGDFNIKISTTTNEYDTIALNLTPNSTSTITHLNKVITEYGINCSNVYYKNTLLNKVETITNEKSISFESTDDILKNTIDNISYNSGSISINNIINQVTFNNVEFDSNDLNNSAGTDLDNAYIENEEFELVNLVKTKQTTTEKLTKFIVNGTAQYTTDTDGNLIIDLNNSDLVIMLQGDETEIINITNITNVADETNSNDVLTSLQNYYNFNLRNMYNIELNADIDSYNVDGLNDIYSTGGAINILQSKELNFFFIVDAVVKDYNIWKLYQANLNAIAKTRKDCIAVLFAKKFTLSEINTINNDFNINGTIDKNGYTRFADYGNEFSTMLGMYYDTVLDGGKKDTVPSIGYWVGRWLLGLYDDKNFIPAGLSNSLNVYDKELNVSVDEEIWDVVDKLKINIPVKIKDSGNVMWFTNTTYNKNSDLREVNNMFTLIYLIRKYYPILIKYIHRRFIDNLTGVNYIVQMKNEMISVLNEPSVVNAFAEQPVLDLISTEEELENGIIVWSHKIKFSKKIKAIEVKFIFEKSGSIYIDLLENV